MGCRFSHHRSSGPNEGPGNGLGDGGQCLHEWAFAGAPADDSGVPGRPPGIDGEVYDEMMSTGAVEAGRGTFARGDPQLALTASLQGGPDKQRG